MGAIESKRELLFDVRNKFKKEYLAKTYKGMLPIHMACWKGHCGIVSFLLQHGCDVNATDEGDWRPVHIASFCKNTELLRLLISNKCLIDCKTKEDKTPIDYARKENCSNSEECVEMLRKYAASQGACANLPPVNGRIGIADSLVTNNANSAVLSNDFQRQTDSVGDGHGNSDKDSLSQNYTDSFKAALNNIFEDVDQFLRLKEWFGKRDDISKGNLSRCHSFHDIFYEISKKEEYDSLIEFFKDGGYENAHQFDEIVNRWEKIKGLRTECPSCKKLLFKGQICFDKNEMHF